MQGLGLVYPMLQKKQGDCSYPLLLLFCFAPVFSWCRTICAGCGSPGRGVQESHFPTVASCAPYGGLLLVVRPLAGCQASCLVMLLYDTSCSHLRAQEVRRLVPGCFQTPEVVLKDISVDLRRARATEGCWIAILYSPTKHIHPPLRLLLIIKLPNGSSLKIDTFSCPQQCSWSWAL